MKEEKYVSADGDFFKEMVKFERSVIAKEAPEYLAEYDKEMEEKGIIFRESKK